MTRLRPLLGRLALAWLFCQAATMTVAPVVFWYGSDAAGLLECTCAHDEHATCPMHHDLAPGSKLCLMQRADGSGPAVLSSFFGVVGFVPVSTAVIAAPSGRPLVHSQLATISPRPAPPDPPPPRA